MKLAPRELDAQGPRLDATYFERPVLRLARDLLGRVLVTTSREGVTAGRIVETEAYRGPEDLAAHSAGGRRTARTEAMFGAPGQVYMYLLYGVHWAFNVVAGPRGAPHAVLVRAVEPLVAGAWVDKPWRFYEQNNPHVSVRPR